MRAYRNSNGGVPRVASGGAQTSASSQPCCCGGNCANTTGCSGAPMYCTGLRFLLPSVTLTVPPISDTYSFADETSSWQSLTDDPTAFIPFNARDGYIVEYPHSASAFTMDVTFGLTIGSPPDTYAQYSAPANYGNGMYRKITFGAESHTFDGMDGSGSTVSFSSAVRERPEGDTSGSSTVVESLGGGSFRNWTKTWTGSESKSATDICEIFDFYYKAETSAASDQIGIAIVFGGVATRYSLVEGTSTVDWDVDYDNPVTHHSDGEFTRYGKSVVSMVAAIGSTSSGINGYEGELDVCAGDTASWTHTGSVSTLQSTNAVATSSTATGDSLSGGITLGAGFDYSSGTAITSLGTGVGTVQSSFTDAEVGCKGCSRTMHFAFTRKVVRRISTGALLESYSAIVAVAEADRELVEQTWDGYLYQASVYECGMYGCEWSGSVDVSEPSGTPYEVSVTVTRLGNNLWRAMPMDVVFKAGASCPSGTATIRQDLNPHYVKAAVFTGSGGGPFTNADWTDPEYAPLPPYTTHISDYTLTVSDASRNGNTNTYYCDDTVEIFNTGEETSGGNDLHWTVENANESGVYVDALLETNTFVTTYYATPIAGAAWIGIDAVGSPYTGLRKYRTEVSISGTPDTDITGKVASDNQCVALYVNDVLVATNLTPNDVTSHENKHDFTIPASYLETGVNTIDFEVRDDGEVAGLLVEWDD